MDLKLSWDLFVIVFFAIVTAYSFIIGRRDTLKIIIGTYIATLTADGIGNIFEKIFAQTTFFNKLIAFIGYSGDTLQLASILKILLFIAIIVLLTIYGDYEVDPPPQQHAFINLLFLAILSLLSGGLILSTIIVFANGGSLIGGTTAISESFQVVYEQSRFVKGLLDFHDIWFSLPGLVFVLISIFQRKRPTV
jgi:hypothetical protein